MYRCVSPALLALAVDTTALLQLLLLLQRQRSHQKHDFFRKTKRGQPVMKYRVDKILEQLQQEKKAAGC